MKRINYILILLSLVAMVSCMDKYTEFYTANSPVYLSYDSLRSAVKSVNPTELNNPGKIYFKDNFLFVVVRYHAKAEPGFPARHSRENGRGYEDTLVAQHVG